MGGGKKLPHLLAGSLNRDTEVRRSVTVVVSLRGTRPEELGALLFDKYTAPLMLVLPRTNTGLRQPSRSQLPPPPHARAPHARARTPTPPTAAALPPAAFRLASRDGGQRRGLG